jgi:hypothetical protein
MAKFVGQDSSELFDDSEEEYHISSIVSRRVSK